MSELLEIMGSRTTYQLPIISRREMRMRESEGLENTWPYQFLIPMEKHNPKEHKYSNEVGKIKGD